MSRLSRRLRTLERNLESLTEKLGPNALALLEEGMRTSTQATSSGRIEQIANVVAHGLSENDRAAETDRGMLWIINQLTDADVIRLVSFHRLKRHDAEWLSGNKGVLCEVSALMEDVGGVAHWTAAAYEAQADQSLSYQKLVSLGLLKRDFSIKRLDPRNLKRGWEPEISMKPLEMTSAAEVILSRMGVV